ncbi:uncharacterized protein LOC141856005 isoform X2 [Brevipalpus obovatus]
MDNLMTQSMYCVSTARKRHPELVPVTPRECMLSSRASSYSLANRSKDSSGYKLSESMMSTDNCKENFINKNGPRRAVSMSRLDQLAKPRQRYLEESLRLRNSVAAAASSVTSTPRNAVVLNSSRPTSVSGASDQSTTSSVGVCRRRTTARRPRPVSIGGVFPDAKSVLSQSNSLRSPITPTTPSNATVLRPNRARSAGSTNRRPIRGTDASNDQGSDSSNRSYENQAKPVPPRKPAHVKAAAAARRSAKIYLQQQQQHQQHNDNNKCSGSGTVSPISSSSSSAAASSKIGPNECYSVDKNSTLERAKQSQSKASSSSPSLVSSSQHNRQAHMTSANKENMNESSSSCNGHQNTGCNNIGGGSQNGVESETSLNQGSLTSGSSSMVSSTSSSSRKITSEEEYKRILAEKRRLAREQAEREAQRRQEEEARKAEQERLRAEEEQKRREERQRQEEEAEQIRLAEEHRLFQEQKLHDAMQELRKREEEERHRREQEAALIKAEREAQEARAKEEIERGIQERLRKDEEERMLRKKRVEAIMSRTRKAQGNKPSFPDSDGSRTPDSNDASPVRTIEESKGVGFQSIYLDVRD